ncbi:glycosyltransferase family 41 protein [Methylosinus sp. PW1]|uniref:O-linked N-acetylglucosamine transferase, SPINDLY family protein n=1 Tax=Methylosinus sp. PW1 TaxID=107636 RepID=UPI0009FD76F5|nr:glycosyltransferase family 41 protein [Methylosinus sp. PW1]
MARKTGLSRPRSIYPQISYSKEARSGLPVFIGTATPENLLRLGHKHHSRGLRHAKANEWELALREFGEAIRCAPDQPNFNYALGGALSQLGRLPEAMEAYRRELAILPGDAASLVDLGTCLARMGRRKDGILCFETALRYKPKIPFAQYNLGLALLGEKRRIDAIEALSRAIRINPSYGDAYILRSLAHAMGGENEKSMIDLRAAAAVTTKNHAAMLDVGHYFHKNARDLEAGQIFEMAARIAPDVALAQFVFGHFLIVNRRYEDGLTFVERAIEIDPNFAEAYVARGHGYLSQGRTEEAVANFRRAGALSPGDASIASSLLFALQHKPGVTKAELLAAHRTWAALDRPKTPKERTSFTNSPAVDRKLRIGLVSADMRGHAVTFLTLRAFEELAKLGYEIFCYKTDRKFADDKFSGRYKAIAQSWRDVSDLDDEAFVALIAEHEIDILFDLSGHTAGNRLSIFARRAAPVQLSWAGYVGTIGLDAFDGIIADPIEVPLAHDEFYAEPVVRLPDCYVCYHPPARAPAAGPLPYFEKGAFTFGCFNRPAKLNAAVGRVWSRILERVPESRILMVYGGLNESATREAVYRTLQSGGVSRDRVDLVGETEQAKLLKYYAQNVDFALDPFPYSGGVTTLEAMWMGVPTVTLVGETFAGRHSATHLAAAGLAGFCTSSEEEYVDLAVSWTQRPHELAALRAELRDKVAASPLNDPVRFARNLDNALSSLWRQWCSLRQSMDRSANDSPQNFHPAAS